MLSEFLKFKLRKINLTYFECNVVGEKAKNLIVRCMEASNLNKKILITFCLGDLSRTEGQKKVQGSIYRKY